MARMTVKNQGELLQFLSAGDANISSCKVYFSPKQSGEGTPSPENVRPIEGWSGIEVTHCGKNLWEFGDQIFTRYKEISLGSMPKGVYTFSAKVHSEDTDSSVCNVWFLYGKSGATPRPTNGKFIQRSDIERTSVTFDFTEYVPNLVRLYASASLGASADDFVSFTDIQLELGSTPTPYESYQSRAEKELPSEYQRVEYIESTGTQYFWTDINVQDGLTVESASTYSPSQDSYLFGGAASAANDRVCFNGVYGGNLQCAYPSAWFYAGTIQQDGKTIERITTTLSNNKVTIYKNGDLIMRTRSGTLPKETGAKCVCFGYRNSIGNVACFYKGKVYELRIKKGTDMLANFVPCLRRSDSKPGMYDTVSQTFYVNQGTGEFIVGPAVNRYEIDWSEDLGTIYGGYVDLVSGELVENYQKIIVDDTSNLLSLDARSNPSEATHRYIKIPDSGVTMANNDGCCCDKLNLSHMSIWYYPSASQAWLFGPNKTSLHFVVDNAYVGITSETSDADRTAIIKTWLADNPLTFIIPTATPITHQLSPAILTTLTGNNTFWSNADYIEIEYDLIETQEIMDVRKRIIGSSPHLETAGGQFSTDIATPLKSCRISFSPIQEGEGDPSPSNVRPIKGWDGITVTRCGKNLYNYENVGYYNGHTGEFVNNNGYSYWRIKVKEGDVVRTSGGGNGLGCYFKDGKYVGSVRGNMIIVPSGVDELTNNFTHDNMYENIVTLNNPDMSYEPYIETSITISFPQTIYGGYVDLVKGEIVEEQVAVTLDGVNVKFNKGIYPSQNLYGAGWVYANPLGLFMKQENKDKFLCDKLPIGSSFSTIPHYDVSRAGNLYYMVRILEKSDYADELTNEQVQDLSNEWLQDNPLTFVYPLKTANVYSLTPQTIKALKGINNVFSDANGSVELTYWTH